MLPLVFPVTLLVLSARVASAGGLSFTTEPQDAIVDHGGPVRLDCQAKSLYGEPTIHWRTEDGQPINFIGDTFRSQLANGSLYISSFYSNNSELIGGYQCLASIDNVGAIVSRTAMIRHASLPRFAKEPQDTMLYVGQIAYLSCSLQQSYSPVQIEWLKDEQPLQLDDTRMTVLPSGALEISDFQWPDVGSYRCKVSGFGQTKYSNKAQVGLLPSDNVGETAYTSPTFAAKPSPQIAVEGSTITLECAANSNPKPNIIWLKDGDSLDLDRNRRYRKVGSSSLMIMNLTTKDDGSYQCRAENSVESLDEGAEVTVQVPPKFVKMPEDKVASESQDLEFECEVSGKPKPKITWLKNGERIKENEYWQLVNGNNLRINGILPIDAGIFQCVGMNPAGTVQASARLIINQPKKRKQATTKSAPKQYRRPVLHRPFYNDTWQHPSTLLGHTSSAFTPNPSISLSPASDPNDLLESAIDPNLLHNPVSHSVDDTDSFESIEGSVPSPPRNLSFAIVNPRFVTLHWQEPENPNGQILTYSVFYKKEGMRRERVINTTSDKQTEAMIQGLLPGTTYQFHVVAHNTRGPGASSQELKVTTESEADVPQAPLNLEGHATSHASIALSWDEPIVAHGSITKYIITYMEEDNVESTVETIKTTYELKNLVPYTEYNIWVRAVNENGAGIPTKEISVRTYSAPPSQPPYNVTLEASSTSIIIQWEPPLEGLNGKITGYKIRYRRQDRRSPSNTITTSEANQRLYVLDGLEKHTAYQVRICALNVNGTGPWTEWLSVETYESDLNESMPPPPPSNLRTKAMADSIAVLWNVPKNQNVRIRGYILKWGEGYPDVNRKEFDGKQRFYTIENLEPLKEYVIALSATNNAGEGAPVYNTVRTTEVSLPESVAPLIPPVELKAIVLSSSTVVLYWTDSALSKNQYVTDNRYYTVRYNIHPSPGQVILPRYKYYNASDLNCMIDDLKPNTLYEFTVKVIKGRRESPWSMVVLNQTQEAAPSSAPRNLTVETIKDRPTSVILRWLPPKQSNGQITGYVIFYSTDNTKWDRDWRTEGLIGDKTEYVVRALQLNTTYFFKIQARNSKGYGPFSTPVHFKTPHSNGMEFYDEMHGKDGRGLTSVLIYVIVGCSIVLVTGIAVGVVIICCRRNPNSPEHKKGYMKEINQKVNIKPPDLWIHHDQMELKALEKSSVNGEASTSGATSNTLPRSGNQDYEPDNVHMNSSSLDKRTYMPSYMGNSEEKCSTLSRQHNRGSHKPKLITLPVDSAPLHQPIATATPIVNSSLSQPTIHSACSDSLSVRQNYPRTMAQYSLNRAHITLEPTPESSPDSCNISSSYEPLQSQVYTGGSSSAVTSSGGSQTYNTNSTQYGSSHYGGSNQSANSVGNCLENNHAAKRLQGHPLKSFSVPAPPPQSAPSTPAQQKHGVSQVTVRPTISGSPYKKPPTTSQLAKNRITSISSTTHTPEEIERLKPSYSTEELNQEMANLEGLMKDLNAITASEFEC